MWRVRISILNERIYDLFLKYRFDLLNWLCRKFDSHHPHVEISILNGRIYDFFENIDLTSLIGYAEISILTLHM